MQWEIEPLINPHTHLREDKKNEGQEVVGALVDHAAAGGAIALGPMPNTEKGLLRARDVTSYIAHAKDSKSAPMEFIPIVQLTEQTTEKTIDSCVAAGIYDAKVYPFGRTTKSHLGVKKYERIIPVAAYAGSREMRTHVHPEHPLPFFENRDAEFAFLPIADMLVNEGAIVVWEHGTDARCIPFWKHWAKTGRFYVTLTAHHLATNESETYGDVQAVCKPPYKTENDRESLKQFVMEGHSWVMAGGDDAPHPKGKKHVPGPCACGAYTAPFLLPLYAHALSELLESEDPDDEAIFRSFINYNALKVYGDLFLHLHMPRVRLVKKEFRIPRSYKIGSWEVEPFWAGRTINYSIEQ